MMKSGQITAAPQAAVSWNRRHMLDSPHWQSKSMSTKKCINWYIFLHNLWEVKRHTENICLDFILFYFILFYF